MKISEHANYLLNEFGRLQFDYAAFCKPYGESLRNEARNNLEEYIAELEAENAELKAVIDRLIEAGEKMFTAVIAAADPYDEGMREWDKLVRDRKEG